MPFTTGLLGAHVGWRPCVSRTLADVLLSKCQPKIDDKGFAFAIDANVARLHVTVDKSLLVSVVQCFGHRGYQFGGFPVFQPILFDLGREVGSLDVFRHDVTGAVLRAADIVNWNDAGVIEVGNRASFGQIRLGILGFRDQLGVGYLDGDQPSERPLARQIHAGRRPLPEGTEDLELVSEMMSELLEPAVDGFGSGIAHAESLGPGGFGGKVKCPTV